MGRGRKGGGRGGGGGWEDQYGEGGVSQDRQESFGLGGRGGASGGHMSGGGEAGGGRHGSNVNYVRHVPKFLQAHAHLLGKPQNEAQEEQLTAKKALPDTWDSEDDDEADRQDALRRAVAEDPSLAEQYPELASVVAKNEAEAAKDLGNKAFSEKRYADAVEHFTKCIKLDGKNEVYRSNRAAALTVLKRFSEALEDARAVVRLKPKWAKGWARMGAAHFGLEEWAEAREAYEKGLELEPDDRAMQEARHKANVNERKAMDMHQHRFKRREPGAGAGNKQQAKQQQQQSKKPRVQAAAGVRNQAMLSFGDDNEEDS